MVNVTKHAYKRMKERCGYSKSTCQRMAEKAFAEGVSHADVSGRLDERRGGLLQRMSETGDQTYPWL